MPGSSFIVKPILKLNIMQKLSFLFDVVKTLNQISKISKDFGMADLSTLIEHVKTVACDHLRSNIDLLVDGLPESETDDKSEV